MKKLILFFIIAILLIGCVSAIKWSWPYYAQDVQCSNCINATTELTDEYWVNESGDTMTGNLNMSGNNLTYVSSIFGNDTYLSIGGASTTHAAYVGSSDTLVAQNIMSKAQATLYGLKMPTNNEIQFGDVVHARLYYCTSGFCNESIYLWINENLTFKINATNITLAGAMFVNETHKVCTSENALCNQTASSECSNSQVLLGNGTCFNLTGVEWITPSEVLDIDKEDVETDLNTFVDIGGDNIAGNITVQNNDTYWLGNITHWFKGIVATTLYEGGTALSSLYCKLTGCQMTGGINATELNSSGFIYANSSHIVCTSENALCNQTVGSLDIWVNESGDIMTGDLNIQANLSINDSVLLIEMKEASAGYGGDVMVYMGSDVGNQTALAVDASSSGSISFGDLTNYSIGLYAYGEDFAAVFQGGDVNVSKELYVNLSHKVCTSENALCNQTNTTVPTKQFLHFGAAAEIARNQYHYMIDTIICSAARGYVMPRAGAITGISTITDMTGLIGQSAKFDVYINGVDTRFGNEFLGVVGTISDFDTQPNDRDTFSAGDLIQVYITLAGPVLLPTVENTVTLVEVEYTIIFFLFSFKSFSLVGYFKRKRRLRC